MSSHQRYEAIPLDDVEKHAPASGTPARPVGSPSRPRSPSLAKVGGSATAAYVRPRGRVIGGLVVSAVVACLFYFGIGPGGRGPRPDYNNPVRWGLAEESLQTVFLDPLRFSTLQATIRSQAETFRDPSISRHFIQILAFIEGACDPSFVPSHRQ
jgi:hypothetical protein